MDEYVTKPLRRGDLLASIAKVLTPKIPGTNIPIIGGALAGLPVVSPVTGIPVSAGLSTAASIGLSESPVAHITEINGP